MSNSMIAMDPAALRELSTRLDRVAGSVPQQRPDPGSLGDPAADLAVQDFNSRWSAHLLAYARVVDQAATQARLTALAFDLLDGR